MEVLVIDRESLTNQLIASRLEAKGCKVTVETNKNAAFDLIRQGAFDCIMVDPAPLSEARPVIIGIWKNLKPGVRPYILLLSKTATTADAVLAGTNDALRKPLDGQELEEKMANAARLQHLSRHLAVDEEVHSSGGMIGKAAFHQLFLSAIDRSFRYGERSMIVFISVRNHDELQAKMGMEGVNDLFVRLTKQMTFMRRQSDVVGRIGQHDFAVLLQRPQYESEPVDAINRFTEALDKFCHELEDKAALPQIRLTLVDLPQGAQHAERLVPGARHVTDAVLPA